MTILILIYLIYKINLCLTLIAQLFCKTANNVLIKNASLD